MVTRNDQPFGWVVLPPLDSVSVIGWVAVVVVVVSLAESDKGGEDVISRGMSIVKGLVTKPVGKRVDAEGGVVDKDETGDSGVVETPSPITPEQTSNGSREEEAHNEDNDAVILVLHTDKEIGVEIGDIGSSDALRVLFEDHPSEMSIHQAFSDRIGVLLGIGVSMVSTMISRPPADGSLNGTATESSKDIL